ncbi:hypothetical protein [Streptomyces sp. NPDC050263]|uniref:hypothetical protein n=1 Tax=Streptomyces sp. NPDC050263 TaxID=3155037 RepID=UPI0034281ACA
MTATAQRQTATVRPVIRSMQMHYVTELERFVGSALAGAGEGAKRTYLDPPIVYPLPVLHPGMKLPLIEEQGRVQSEFKDATAKSIKAIGDYLQSMQKDVKGAAEQYARTKNKGSLHDSIEKVRHEAKQKTDEKIDEICDRAEGLGDANPSWQDMLVGALNRVLNFLTNIMNQVVNFLIGLLDRIEEWIDEAGRKIAGFFEGVGDDIDGFVKSL